MRMVRLSEQTRGVRTGETVQWRIGDRSDAREMESKFLGEVYIHHSRIDRK